MAIAGLGPILSLVVIILIIYIVLRSGRSLAWLVVNSLIGIIILWLVNLFPAINIPINIWSVLITVFGGIAGVALLILLNLAGITL
ncbi:MAG TPA: sigmaK-factor processing regulatory BofA [Candidatus Diapherotrites archaeon]|uniref:SigmaK-factor processing regulatory BofA n=1 Tax=Candidatus Iainarchaeum sp. TaxID=3101447 RepID=A0A7J4IZ90_9ARCH|nr:sigmaK-factor processing regulatory BofA [Candidatus Diapherotrites archaeon]